METLEKSNFEMCIECHGTLAQLVYFQSVVLPVIKAVMSDYEEDFKELGKVEKK